MTENLYLAPSDGTFDVQRVRDWLDARPDAFELAENTYEIANSPTYADLQYADVIAGKTSSGTFVRIAPHEILVVNEGGTQSLRSAIDFLTWLASDYDLRVRTGWGGERDVTEELRVNGVASHYAERIRSTDLEWTRQLREVGFFSDLSYGHDTSVSLDQARRDRAAADEAAIVAYLGSGRLYRAGDTLATNMAGDVLGPADVLTDGLYLWPVQLAAQVRDHHVRLPRHFLRHARSNGFRVPSVDLAALPSSKNIPRLTADEIGWYTRPPEQSDSSSLRVAHGLATTRTLLRSGFADVVYRGFTRGGKAVLATLTMRHSDSYDELVERLRFDHPGIARLLHIGAADPESGQGFRDELVEVEPAGRSILDRAPLPEASAIRCGIEVAPILEAFHEVARPLHGLAPEVIYVDDDLRFTQLTPRSRQFVASVDLRSGGPTSYKLPYSGYEALVLGRGSDESGDVFALCASLFHAVTGKHPFGSQLPEIVQRIAAKQPLPYMGSAAFGAILASGLDADPNKRPTASELAAMLLKLS
ncbi:MAG: hypothetical protein H0T46_14885 [Deltaproteobacteria bacterium]|nr:hypothetical protein [Deltaproteobacteria bacterium]